LTDKSKSRARANKDDDEDLDAILASVPIKIEPVEVDPKAALNARLREILKVNPSQLDPDAEMQRLFGADVVPGRGREGGGGGRRHGAVQQRGGGGRLFNGMPGAGAGGINVRKKTYLVRPKAQWPPVGGKTDGLEMVLHETKRGVNYFKFTWDKGYQKAQTQFHACVETGDPNSLASLLRVHPYHIDTLLQLHDAFEMTDEKDSAMDLLERMIYRFESAWHPKFDPLASDAASSIRMLYSEPENRSIMLGILSYIQEIGRKGCSQTALEWTKMLLALDPSDPLGLLFLVDHFALRRREHAWLLRFYHSPLFEEHDLSILPNFVYSIALAAFYHRRNLQDAASSASSSTSAASQGNQGTLGAQSQGSSNSDASKDYDDLDPTDLLHNAMMMHPHIFTTLIARLSAGSIRANGANVLELPHFANASNTTLPIVKVLCALYIERNHAMWKDPACVQWLKDSAISFYKKLNATPTASTSSSTSDPLPATLVSEELQSKIESYLVLVQELETGNVERIHRHVMLCEYNPVIRMLPSNVLREGFHIYAPGEIGGPPEAAPEPLAPQQLPGTAGHIARILDYLVPFQADSQQLHNVLNLIGYRMGGAPAPGEGVNSDSDEE
jgi:hypothetical protein